MRKTDNTPPNFSYLLRILGGGYLLYLAWDIRDAVADGPIFGIFVALFALVGAALLIHSIWYLARHQYFRKDPVARAVDREQDEEAWEESSK